LSQPRNPEQLEGKNILNFVSADSMESGEGKKSKSFIVKLSSWCRFEFVQNVEKSRVSPKLLEQRFQRDFALLKRSMLSKLCQMIALYSTLESIVFLNPDHMMTWLTPILSILFGVTAIFTLRYGKQNDFWEIAAFVHMIYFSIYVAILIYLLGPEKTTLLGQSACHANELADCNDLNDSYFSMGITIVFARNLVLIVVFGFPIFSHPIFSCIGTFFALYFPLILLQFTFNVGNSFHFYFLKHYLGCHSF